MNIVQSSNQPLQPSVEAGKPQRKHRDWSGATVALAIGLFGLFLGRLGALWIRFDVFSQFSMQFFFLVTAAVIGLVMPRLKSLCTGVVFVLLVALYGLWPLLATGGAEAALAADEKRLVVGQFNIHGALIDPSRIVAAIRGLNADVVTLVEVDQQSVAVLDALKTDWPYQARCTADAECDAAIISKFPLTEMSGQGQWAGPSYVMAKLGPEFGNLTVIGVHTTRFPFARAQFMQVQALAKFLGQVRGQLLVMGDFNATPFSRVTQVLAESLDLRLLTAMPSWPADKLLPQIAIDHVFTSRGIRALSAERAGLSGGSDHLPISITLGVAPH